MNYLAAHQRAAQRYNGEISSLVVAFRSGGKSFLYKERIEQYKGKVMRDEEQSVRFPLSDEGDSRVFSGSCRHFIRFAGGNRDVEITPDDSSELDRLVKESKALEIDSAQQLGVLATNFEELFTKISESHKSDPFAGDEIGPPFQLAILPAGTDQWITSFAQPCP